MTETLSSHPEPDRPADDAAGSERGPETVDEVPCGPAQAAPPEPFLSPVDVPAALADHPRYRVVRPLGRGGMGAVFLAEHKVMNRAVALKVIRPDLTARPELVERFRREVQAAARLLHPN